MKGELSRLGEEIRALLERVRGINLYNGKGEEDVGMTTYEGSALVEVFEELELLECGGRSS